MRLIDLLEASTAPVGEPYIIFPGSGAGSSSEPAASAKLTVGQINKALPPMRTRDLQSIKKTVDAVLTSKQKKPQVPATKAPPATVKPSAGAGAFGAMASQLSPGSGIEEPVGAINEPRSSSSGGTVTPTATGMVHRANPANLPMSSDDLERYRRDAYRASRRALTKMYETQALSWSADWDPSQSVASQMQDIGQLSRSIFEVSLGNYVSKAQDQYRQAKVKSIFEPDKAKRDKLDQTMARRTRGLAIVGRRRKRDQEAEIAKAAAADRENLPQLQQQLKQMKSQFDPNYQYSDDHSFWSRQQSLAQSIKNLEQRIAAAQT